MSALPILQELFESDSVIFFAAGVFISAFICMRQREKLAPAMFISLGIYLICEILSGIRTNYLIEILTLITGTAALGCTLGSALEYAVIKLRKKRSENNN